MDFNRILNPKFLIYVLLRFWYIMVISLVLAVSAAYFYLKITPNIYSASVYVEVADKSSKSGIQNALSMVSMFGELKNLQNEIRSIKSYPLFFNTADSLDFNVSYFVEGEISKRELYKNSPFQVELLESYHNLIHKTFIIEFEKEDKFKIYLDSNGVNKVNPELEGKFGDTLDLNGNLVKINRNFLVKHTNKLRYTFIVQTTEEIAQQYLNIISVASMSEGSTILVLSLKGENPEKLTDFLNQLAYQYIIRDLIEKDKRADNTIKFIDARIDEVYEKLSGVEGNLEKFQLKNKLYNIGGAKGKVSSMLDELEKKKEDLLLQDIYNQNLLEYLMSSEDMILVPSGSEVNDGLLNKMIGNLNSLYAEKASQYDLEKDNPKIVEMDSKIKILRSMLIESVKNIMKVSKITHKDLDEKIQELEIELYGLPSTEREFVKINRDYNLNSHIYNFLLEKKADVGIAKSSHDTENRVIDPARVASARKIAPNESSIYSNAIMAAIAVPYAILLLIFLLKNQIEGVQDIEDNTDIPLLAQITEFKGGDAKAIEALYSRPKSSLAESFRNLRINLQFLNQAEKRNQVIGFTSTISREGKTFCAVNTAASLAFSDMKVILIGADLRKPRMAEAFHINPSIGLTNYISEKKTLEEVIQHSGYKNLDVLLSGPIPPNPSEMLESSRFVSLIEELKTKYDFIIIDSSPVGLVTDYYLIEKIVDVTLFVVRYRYSQKNFVHELDKLVKKDKFKRVFLLLNDQSNKNSYGYGYGYGYGDSGYGEMQELNRFTRLWNRITSIVLKK